MSIDKHTYTDFINEYDMVDYDLFKHNYEENYIYDNYEQEEEYHDYERKVQSVIKIVDTIDLDEINLIIDKWKPEEAVKYLFRIINKLKQVS